MVNIVPSQTTFPPVLPMPENDPTNAGNLTSGTISPSRLPLPTTGSPGAVFAATAPANQLQIGIATTGAPIFAQPAFANLIGTIAGSQMVAPTLNSLGGVVSASAPANQVQTGINTSGAPTFAQIGFSNLSGTIAAPQLVAPTATTLGGVSSRIAPTNLFQTGIDTTGTPTFAQPSFGNLSGQLLATQSPAYTGDVSSASGSLTTAIGANVVTNGQLAQTPTLTVKSNITGSIANPADNTFTAIIDAAMGNTRGAILERGSSGWVALAPGTAGNILTSNGAGADPSYQAGGAAAFPNVLTFANLRITNGATPNSQVAVTADRASLVGATAGLLTTAVNLTISSSTTGANALDSGAVAASTWYAVYIISNGATTAGLLSLSATVPTMPSGYTYKARVGWVRTDASSNLLRTLQQGRRWKYVVTPSTNTANLPIAASGVAGSYTTPTWVAVSLSSLVAPTAGIVFGSLFSNGSAAIVAPNNNYGAYNTTTNYPPVSQNNNSGQSATIPFSMILESSSIYWATYAGASTQAIVIMGYEDNI